MKNSTVFDNLVLELENQLLSNEEQVMLLAGEGQGGAIGLGGNNCDCTETNNCQCNGSNNCACEEKNNCQG